MWSIQTQLLKRTFGLILDIVAPIKHVTHYTDMQSFWAMITWIAMVKQQPVNKPVFKKKRPPKIGGVSEEILTTFFTPVPQEKKQIIDHKKIN